MGVVEAEHVHVPLGGPLLELLDLERLYQEAAAALLLVGVLGAPYIDHDLHLIEAHPDHGACALLCVRLFGVLVEVVHITPAYLERHVVLILPEPLGEVLVRSVAQDGDDDTVLDLSRHLERRRDGGPGSNEMTFMSGLYSLRRLAVPTKVPLVPNPATKCVISPPVCSQISGAVDS